MNAKINANKPRGVWYSICKSDFSLWGVRQPYLGGCCSISKILLRIQPAHNFTCPLKLFHLDQSQQGVGSGLQCEEVVTTDRPVSAIWDVAWKIAYYFFIITVWLPFDQISFLNNK